MESSPTVAPRSRLSANEVIVMAVRASGEDEAGDATPDTVAADAFRPVTAGATAALLPV